MLYDEKVRGFRQPRAQKRERNWQDLVERLELEEASHRAPALRTFLDVGDAVMEPVYRTGFELGSETSANLYFLDYAESAGAGNVTSVCILSLARPTFSVALKASRKVHKVLEALNASASGGAIIRFPKDPAFDREVTVYSRDEAATRYLLFEPTRAILKKALCERGIAPTFLMGERQLLFSNSAPTTDVTPLHALERLAADLLSLYATFSVRAVNKTKT